MKRVIVSSALLPILLAAATAALAAGESVRGGAREEDGLPVPASSPAYHTEISPSVSRLLEVPDTATAVLTPLSPHDSSNLFENVDMDEDDEEDEDENELGTDEDEDEANENGEEDEDEPALANMVNKKKKGKTNKNKKKNQDSSAKSQKRSKSSKSKYKNAKAAKKSKKRKRRKRTVKPTVRPTASPISFTPTYFPTSSGQEEVIVYATSHLILEVDHMRVTEGNKEALKETSLKFLEDNIGGEGKFGTQYVDITKTESRDQDFGTRQVDTTVFELNMTFTMTKSFAKWVDEEWDEEEEDGNGNNAGDAARRLGLYNVDRNLANQNKRARYANLCTSGSINRKNKPKRCNKKKKKRRRRELQAVAFNDDEEEGEVDVAIAEEEDEEDFYNKTFLDVVKSSTDLEPESIHSVVDAAGVLELLLCGLAHIVLVIFYDVEKEAYDEVFEPYLPFFCRNYQQYECSKYEDYLCDDFESGNCRGPCDDVELSPTMSPHPTVSPTTNAPTTHWSPRPTWDPPATTPQAFIFGAPEAFGQDVSSGDVIQPMELEKAIIGSAAGPGYTILLLDDGTVQMAGHIDSMSDYRGHLGLPRDDLIEGSNPFQSITKVFDTTKEATVEAPRFIKVFAGADQLSPGAMHSLLIDEEGKVWTMGSNTKGQLCLGDFEDRDIPTKVPMSGRIENAALGGLHTLLHHEHGMVFGCGSNENGQIGLGVSVSNSSDTSTIYSAGLVETISAGLSHSLFLAKRKIYVTGANNYGQLCANTTGLSVFTATELTIAGGDVKRRLIKSFEASMHSSYLLYIDGTMSGCGRNNYGQLGDVTTDDSFLTSTLTLARIRRLGVGPSSNSALFIGYNNEAYATGLNDRGQLGLGDTMNRVFMSKVSFGEDIFVNHMSPASDHSVSGALSLATPKTLFHWGDNASFGSDQGSSNSTIPVQSDDIAIDVAAGSGYSIILLEDGTARAGGFTNSMDSYRGHLGLPREELSEGQNELQTISQVVDETGTIVDAPRFKKVLAGAELLPGEMHSMFIDEGGHVWATGSNSKGQLCLGDNEDRDIPTKIALNRPITSVAVGGQHTLLLVEGQQVFVCGSNEFGQIGLGNNATQVNSPTLNEDLILVETISAGLDFSLFMSSYQGFLVTGSNTYGQFCADSGGSNIYSPSSLDFGGVIKTGDVKSFKAGRTSSYMLLLNGYMISCGRNNNGQLGDGTNADSFGVNVPLPALIRRVDVGPSSDSAFFIGGDGNTYATGLNDKGQLGVGDKENRNVLTRVDFGSDNFAVQQISTSGVHTLCRAGLQDEVGNVPDELVEFTPQISFDLTDLPESALVPPITENPSDLATMHVPNILQKQSYADMAVTSESQISI